MRKISIKIILLLLAGSFHTCQDNPGILYLENTRLPGREVTLAREWYRNAVPGEVLGMDRGENIAPIQVKPAWERAEASADKKQRIVEIDVLMKGALFFVMDENKQKTEETGDERYAFSRTRLVIRTNLKNGKTDGFLMTVVPSVEYVELTGFNPFEKVKYIERDGHFTGRVIYHDLSGELVHGWEYKSGKIVRSIKPVRDGDDPVIMIKSSGSSDCELVEEWGWTRICTDWYQYDSKGDPVYLGTTCTDWVWGLIDSYWVCVPGSGGDGEWGDGEWGDGEEGGGGGGSGGGGEYYPPSPTPPPSSFVPQPKDIFRNSSLSNQDWVKLQGILSQMTLACLGESLYNGLINWLGDNKINFDFNDGDNGRFVVSGDTLSISIGSHGDADQLLHEMVHAYQFFKRTGSKFLEGLVNVEIEAHYAQYLYASGRADYKDSEWEKRDNNEPRRTRIKDLVQLIDEKGELRPNRTESDLEIYILNEVIPVFREVNAYKDYSLDYDRVGLDNFDTLEELTTDC